MAQYEVIIVQERYDVDPDLVQHLSLLGRRFSIVRPHIYDLINGGSQFGFCATARNYAVKSAEGDWVVFLSEGTEPDSAWFAALEEDLDVAERVGAAASVSADSQPDATRVRDIAYRLDLLASCGGFDEDRENEGCEDFVVQLDLMANGFDILQGCRHCDTNFAADA